MKEKTNHLLEWKDVEQHFQKLEERQVQELFINFAKAYFLAEPSVKNDYRKVWKYDEVPASIKLKLGINKKENIRLVLENQMGGFSYVYCLFQKNQEEPLRVDDSIQKEIKRNPPNAYHILFTNASDIDSNITVTSQPYFKAVLLEDLTQLSSETLQVMTQITSGKGLESINAVTKSPRPYQLQAIAAAEKHFEEHERGQLIMPCGSGKTLTALWIQERLNSHRTLLLFPSLALLRQTKKEWASHQRKFVPYLSVCSEKDIDKEEESIQAHIYSITGPVSTNPQEIRGFLTENQHCIIYSTYQSLGAIVEACKGTSFQFDLALCDEAHKTAGHNLASFSLVHDTSKIAIKKRLYMTATPRVVSNYQRAKLNDLSYTYDMDDPRIFGKEFYRMSFKEAIDKEILVDYDIVAMGVSDEEIHKGITEGNIIKKGTTLEELAHNYALHKFMTEYTVSHVISFHSSIKQAKEFQKRHQKLFPDIKVFHVNGESSTYQRTEIFNKFKRASKAVLTNVRCLTEGVDIPSVGAVYFCNKSRSKIDIVQAAGRALRRDDSNGKEKGYIVLPIFHETEHMLDEQVETGEYQDLVKVVQALSDQDERITAEIKAYKKHRGRGEVNTSSLDTSEERRILNVTFLNERLANQIFSQTYRKIRFPWQPFEEARETVRNLGLKSKEEWVEYCKNNKDRLINIPAYPNEVYEGKGWVSWGDWLGKGHVHSKNREYKPFEEAREFAQKLELKSRKEWKEYHKKNRESLIDIPVAPDRVYKGKGWVSWGDWLGTGFIAHQNREYKPFEEAREFVKSLELKGQKEWKEYYRNNKDKLIGIPAAPDQVYKDKGWVSWGDFLGTGFVAHRDRKYKSFEEVREFARSLKLKGQKEWREYYKSNKDRLVDISAAPYKVYKGKGWVSWGDFLGTDFVALFNRKYKPFAEAREVVQSLKLKSQKEWGEYCKNNKDRFIDIPVAPDQFYRDKGWVSWGDWLGKTSNPKSRGVE